MPLKEVLQNGKALFTCPGCGRDFESEYTDPAGGFGEEMMRGIYERMHCPECIAKEESAKQAAEAEARKQELLATLDERMAKTGFTERFQKLEKPYIRSSAVWMWLHRNGNLLASGATGTGKTSSAAFVIREMLKSTRLRVKYRTWQMLQAEFVKAKTSDGDNELWFFERIDGLDYLIIDELIGKKGEAKLSPSGQDLLFNLIDGAYSQSRRTKIWILGNFFEGAIDRLIDDPLPTRRRLQDSFALAWFEYGNPTVDESIKIFDEQEL